MNNKGQSLVIFILVLPLFFTIVFCIKDLFTVRYEKNKLRSLAQTSILYVMKDDKSYEDDITKKYLSKLNIVDKENIEKYFTDKFISLDYEYAKRYTEYKRNLKYNNMIKRSNKGKFYNDL